MMLGAFQSSVMAKRKRKSEVFHHAVGAVRLGSPEERLEAEQAHLEDAAGAMLCVSLQRCLSR